MTSINDLWHYITINNLWWAMRCDCCDLLVLEPPPPPQQMSANGVLRLAARCLPSITFVGEGCIALAHDEDMSDALGQLCVEVGDGEALAPLHEHSSAPHSSSGCSARSRPTPLRRCGA
jgi:hypothetical protein